jgi:hypothetical protein
MSVEQDQNRFPHSSGLNAGETTSPTMEPFPFLKLKMFVRIFFDGDKLRHRLAAFGDQHGFPFRLNFAITAKQWTLNAPAAIFFHEKHPFRELAITP